MLWFIVDGQDLLKCSREQDSFVQIGIFMVVISTTCVYPMADRDLLFNLNSGL